MKWAPLWLIKHGLLTDLPPSSKALGCKWIFRKKLRLDGLIEKFKARLLLKVGNKKKELTFLYTYLPIWKITTIRMLIAIGSIYSLQIHQLYTKIAFLKKKFI